MTINSERFDSMLWMRHFMEGLCDLPLKAWPTKTEMRKTFYRILRHYPEKYWMNDLQKKIQE